MKVPGRRMKRRDRSKLKPAVKCPQCNNIHILGGITGSTCAWCQGNPKLVPSWSNGEQRIQ